MTTKHPNSTRMFSLFTIIILLFGLVGCNSNDNKGQNGGESINKEQETTYTADYKWWEDNVNAKTPNTTVSYFESKATETSSTRYLNVTATNTTNGNTELCFFITEKDSIAYVKFVVDNTAVEYIDYSVYEDGWLDDSLAYSWNYEYTSNSGEKITAKYMIEKSGDKLIIIYSDKELLGAERSIYCSGNYLPTTNPPEESSTPNTDNNTSNNTEIDVDFNVNVDERILVSGTIMSTGNLTIGIGKYCLQLEEPITIKLNDPYFANSSKIYECSVLYFYDDTELIDSTEKSYYLTDDDIGKKCSIFARIEDYRDGGDLYFLYPEIWFD